MLKQQIIVSITSQTVRCFEDDKLLQTYVASTAKNGAGELMDSECTPRGQHCIDEVIGCGHAENSVFVGRVWTGEIYSDVLARAFPERDWILTRILWLRGLEPGRNQGGNVDTKARFIYIHGTPDTIEFGVPGSHGCIRMRNQDVVTLADWVHVGTPVLVEE